VVSKSGAPTFLCWTLGCKVNRYDTQSMADALGRGGFRPVEDGGCPDVVVVNTCVVTGRGEAKSRQAVRRAARAYPDAVIVVAGCLPQVSPEAAAALPVQGQLGTANRRDIVRVVRSALAGRDRADGAAGDGRAVESSGAAAAGIVSGPPLPVEFEEMPVGDFTGRTRANVKVQDGCDQRCSYCVIPLARGPSRSRAPVNVVAELLRLAAFGFSEVVLTGIHLGSYGRDLPVPVTLTALLRLCLEVPGLARIRLSSIEPVEVTGELLALMAAEPRLCPHLHIPLQSGSDRVLRAMNRPYTTFDYRALVERSRALVPALAVTTDVIAGFPGETLEDFAATAALLREAGFSRLHVFPYSPRPGTPAAGLPGQVPRAERDRRAGELIAIGKELSAAFHQEMVGRKVEVLVEGSDEREGLTANYVRVVLPAPPAGHVPTRLATVLVEEAEHWGVRGHLIDETAG
jgi:threonylcarbamoyladenosine tRNA methylthiotransferase MtaB